MPDRPTDGASRPSAADPVAVPAPARSPGSLVAVPWRAVGATAAVVTALLVAVAPRYGWHRDELYFLEAGRHHLAWGYPDQPPFTPLVARLAHAVAPGNLAVLRLAPALTTAATVVLGALLVRELGGGRRAQGRAAATVAVGGFTLGVGHVLSTAAFDLTAWMALLWLTARLLRTGSSRWWLAYGAVAGVALWNKHLVVLLTVTVLAGLVAGRRWDLLVSPWLLVGGALATVLVLPNLLWQADHGWPQLDMAEALSERLAGENRATLVPSQLLFLGPPLAPLLWFGARWLARDPAGERFRPLLWAWPVGMVLAFATGGRPYYVLPLTTVVALAGVVAVVASARLRVLPWLLGANAVVSVLLGLPVLPRSAIEVSAAVNETAAEQVGWPELADQVARVVADLPPDERASVVLLAQTYGEAGALDRFGPSRGLPRAHSGHNGYADFGRPTDEAATVVAVRHRPERLARLFDRCEVVDHVDNGLDVDNEVQGTPITVCRGLRGSWADAWEELRYLS